MIKEIEGLKTQKKLKRLLLSDNPLTEIKNIGHLDKLEDLSIRLKQQFWDDLKVKMGDDFFNDIGISHRGYFIKNPQKLVEYSIIMEKKIKGNA